MKTENDNSKGDDSGGDASWLERNVNVVIAGLVIACIGSLVAQLLWAPLFADKHGEASHVEASHDDGSHDETSHDEHAHDEVSHDGASHLHPAEFAVEEVFGFEAMFGFAAFVAVVFLGTGLRLIIMRDEDYYDS
ncbi:hypothetical protein N9X53_05110 [Mariniblastus sp.]|nr:hypothetical protein [Mariniblastus sp.]